MSRRSNVPPQSPETAQQIDDRFHAALAERDLDQLMACWAEDDDIVCIHPGVARMLGAAAIRIGHGELLKRAQFSAEPPIKRQVVQMLDCEIHSLLQRWGFGTPDGTQHMVLCATNVYHRTAQGWRLVFRQVSPGSSDEMQQSAAHTVH